LCPPVRERTWILDPIDGTKGFIRGEHFCVALGMAHDGVPTIGVLGCPNLPFEWRYVTMLLIGESVSHYMY
jgi:3'-phosphoadenosine 5'-phosphosulfate (PAPS) 3'-phosphatase